MKKCLTVLLVIAVMFTFSFGSAFAANMDKTLTVETEDQAYAMIDEWYDDAKDQLAAAVSKALVNDKTSEGAAAIEVARQEVAAAIDKQYAKAVQYLYDQIKEIPATTTILGYTWDKIANTDEGYVNFRASKVYLVDASWDCEYWDATEDALTGLNALKAKAGYDKVKADAIAAIQGYNLDQFAKDDAVKFGNVTKSSYEWATIAQTDALAELNALGEYKEGEVTIASVEAIYKITNAGTLAETKSGTFFTGNTAHPGLNKLKTTSDVMTDNAKIEYAKAQALASVKKAIEDQRDKELDVQNKIIFSQSIASKPNQAIIDAANEEIAKINEKCDALLEVMTYRIENAEYKVIEKSTGDRDYIRGYYEGKEVIYLGHFGIPSNNYSQDEDLTTFTTPKTGLDELSFAKAIEISEHVKDLQEDAELLKESIAVDGATALAIDEALAEAVKETYLTGTLATLNYAMSDTIVHVNAHNLLGTGCKNIGAVAHDKVTLNGKEYDTVANWATINYSTNNTAAVKAIIKDAEAAIKAAETVEAANEAFLDAYAEYDAVLTKDDQKALFKYSGSLYGKDKNAVAEVEAYIAYKVGVMTDYPAGDADKTIKAMKEYFGTGVATTNMHASFLEEVIDAASLQAAIDEVKAAADSIKTAKELKAEGDALVKSVNELARPVTLAQKDAVLALYDDVADYLDYCKMVGYDTTFMTRSVLLISEDVEDIAGMEKSNLDAMKKALGDVAKLTLDAEADVDAFAAAEDAYNDLYGVDGTYKDAFSPAADYNQAGAYVDKIFDLKVAAAERLIAALPTYPTTAQILAAQEAVDELGFEGICAIRDSLLTKLDKFAQDAKEAVIHNVEALKITASSSAAKGAMTIKWRVSGNTSGVEAFEIWRSTKKSSGFQKFFTTANGEKRTYKNTKNLKKGTRYYYKVRAIAYVDGEKITSDWSNKAYRIAK